jgi:hypothetical protein
VLSHGSDAYNSGSIVTKRHSRNIQVVNSASSEIHYGGPQFGALCNEALLKDRPFLVTSAASRAALCRRSIEVYESSCRNPPRGWARLIFLVRASATCMRVPLLMSVCNEASLRGWSLTIQGERNHVAYFSPSTKNDVTRAPTDA